MPNLEWNKSYWDGAYDWKGRGEEWSKTWGGSESQWFGSLYPRLHRFLPAQNILEIAPGFGRWTKYLLSYLNGQYKGVDMSQECIDYCKSAFPSVDNLSFFTNDGLSLSMIENDAFDLIFSFDSLVHVELDVHETYIPQILKKLNRKGVAFIHHSNWAASNETCDNTHCRGESVSADAYEEIVIRYGGHVMLQECLNWGTNKLIDAFTLFCRRDRERLLPTIRIENPEFMHEAKIIREVHAKYCGRTL